MFTGDNKEFLYLYLSIYLYQSPTWIYNSLTCFVNQLKLYNSLPTGGLCMDNQVLVNYVAAVILVLANYPQYQIRNYYITTGVVWMRLRIDFFHSWIRNDAFGVCIIIVLGVAGNDVILYSYDDFCSLGNILLQNGMGIFPNSFARLLV